MKKLLLFTVLFFSINTLFSQSPTLTMLNSAWAVGNTSTQYNLDTTGVTPGTSGANVTWNFQNLTVSTSQTISTSFVSPSTTPNSSQFPGATVAASSNGIYQYFSYSTSSCSMLGVDGMGLLMSYSDPMKYFDYPFTYNSNCTDNFISDYILYSYNFHRTGTINTTGDAWGTLQLPGKTINNVLRVKMIQTTTDVTSLYTTNTTMTTYWWFDGINKTPILDITLSESTNTFQPGVITYTKRVVISPSAVGIEDITKNQNFNIFPNPAKDNFTIASSSKKGKWELTDFTGKLILSGIITETNQIINCGEINNGMYLVRITDEHGKQSTKKLLINK